MEQYGDIHIYGDKSLTYPARQYVGDFPVRYLTTGSNDDITAMLRQFLVHLFQYECHQSK